MENMAKKTLDGPQQYTVAWLAALPSERTAAEILLDEKHEKPAGFTKHVADTNSYTWGRMGKHNIVIASLPSGEYGEIATADMTGGLRASLPHIRVGLLVGIAAGVTGEREESEGKFSIDRDIRLGDIAVSNPDKANGGIVQYDLYKAKVRKVQNPDGSVRDESYMEAKGFVNAPPRALRSALSALQAKHEYDEPRVAHHLEKFKRNKKTRTFTYPGAMNTEDGSDVDESDEGDSDDEDPLRVAISEKRATLRSGAKHKKLKRRTEPAIHYGTIASGNTLMKDKAKRNDLLSSLKANNFEPICFEMEAAGIMSSFPSLVIRGICDYGDERKNDAWQKYAAATAAAFAKEFLECLDAEEVEQEEPISRVEKLVEQLNVKVEKHVADYRHQQMDKWLSPPDPSTNFNKAKELRHPKTGRWFLESEQYEDWRTNVHSSLWLHGLAGCGKTVLSSTIIADVQERSDETVLFFFFDFNNSDKQSFEKMLRSLISQIYLQCEGSRKHLDHLYLTCAGGGKQPETGLLIMTLQSMINESETLYIVLDALDECKTRHELLDWLEGLPRDNVHLILTSRKEYDIETSLAEWMPTAATIPIQNKPVDEDIRAVIQSRLAEDKELRRWQSSKQVREEIETKLMEKADGMFRWAVCQLDALRTCLDLPTLKVALASLPKDLDEAYARILKSIRQEGYERNAIRLLQFLLYTDRPLLLEEAVDAIAVYPNIDDWKNGFQEQNRMPNPDEIVRYCSSLVQRTSRVVGYKRQDTEAASVGYEEGQSVSELQLAHFSVKEYLVSARLEESFQTSLGECCARAALVEVGLSYMLAASGIHRVEEDSSRVLPLARLSAQSWMDHARKVEARDETVMNWICKLFTTPAAYRYWLQHFNPERPMQLAKDCTEQLGDMSVLPIPLYYASLAGLSRCVKWLIDQGSDVNAKCKADKYGRCTYALIAASYGGHEQVVQQLLDKGANVDAEGYYSGSALRIASFSGHLAVVQLLLDRHADINHRTQGGHESALYAASEQGHVGVVQLLLNNGADVNLDGGLHGYPLHAACVRAHESVVQLLLRSGANAHANNKRGNVLASACFGGSAKIVQLVLSRGLDVNADNGAALKAACQKRQGGVARILLDAGADATEQAFGFASHRGREKVVQMLLDAGAKVTASILESAASNGHEKIVQILLNAGAEVSAKAIESASWQGHEKVVRLLLHAGAYVTASAIIAASTRGHEKTVRVLLDAGADVNARDTYGQTALHWASYKNAKEVMPMILNAGTEVDAEDSKGRSSLLCASRMGHADIVQILLDAGADVNAHTEDGSALDHASQGGHGDVVKILLAAGADVHAGGGH